MSAHAHRWRIEEQNGTPHVRGVCACGAERDFRSSDDGEDHLIGRGAARARGGRASKGWKQRASRKERLASVAEREAARRKARLEAGLCPKCRASDPQPVAPGRKLCVGCGQKELERSRRRYAAGKKA